MSPKKVILQLLELLPDSCSYDEIKRHIELFDQVQHRQEAMMMGATAGLEVERYPRQ